MEILEIQSRLINSINIDELKHWKSKYPEDKLALAYTKLSVTEKEQITILAQNNIPKKEIEWTELIDFISQRLRQINVTTKEEKLSYLARIYGERLNFWSYPDWLFLKVYSLLKDNNVNNL